MLFFCGATGESLDRSKHGETADPACRDQRTRRWSHTRGARVKSTKAHRTLNTASRSAQLIRWAPLEHWKRGQPIAWVILEVIFSLDQ